MFNKNLFLASDHAGFELKNKLFNNLKAQNLNVFDYGCFSSVDVVDYPDVAKKVCLELLEKKAFAILCCGTGVGMSIAANRFKGIRAVCGVDFFSVKFSRAHNNSNVLCLGGRVIGLGLALELVNIFLNTEFEGGRHINRLKKL